MRIAVDLHMHSCLSPCGDEEMTPNNIVNMAVIKGLDAIAVTDHNTARNLPAIEQVAQEAGMLLLPGLEVQSREEVHLLCYFETVSAALAFSGFLYPFLPDIKNRKELFGPQWVMNADDEVVDEEEKLLIQSVDLAMEEVVNEVRKRGGVVIPAHINKTSNSILYLLGFIPEELNFTTVEIYPGRTMPDIDIQKYRFIQSSDAHQLPDISERDFTLHVENKSIHDLFVKLGCPAQNG